MSKAPAKNHEASPNYIAHLVFFTGDNARNPTLANKLILLQSWLRLGLRRLAALRSLDRRSKIVQQSQCVPCFTEQNDLRNLPIFSSIYRTSRVPSVQVNLISGSVSSPFRFLLLTAMTAVTVADKLKMQT